MSQQANQPADGVSNARMVILTNPKYAELKTKCIQEFIPHKKMSYPGLQALSFYSTYLFWRPLVSIHYLNCMTWHNYIGTHTS